MNATTTTARLGSEPLEPAVRQRRGIPVVWLVPLVAALLAAFLAWRAYVTQGPTVTITFATAEGLEAGKTRVPRSIVPRDTTLRMGNCREVEDGRGG